MAKKKKSKYARARRKNRGLVVFLIILLLALMGVLGWMCLNLAGYDVNGYVRGVIAQFVPDGTAEPTEEVTVPESSEQETSEEPTETTVPPTTVPAGPVELVATASIGAMGDVIMDLPIINAGEQEDGSYDFGWIFRYVSDYTRAVDYSVANLETTLAGTESGYRYSGFQHRNCPDEIVDSLKNAGFDMLLTGNNHCYDTGLEGLQRTLEVIRSRGLEPLGTVAEPEDTPYAIADINGIRVGMLSFALEGMAPEGGDGGSIYLNGIAVAREDEGRINSFNPAYQEPFLTKIPQLISRMKADGADAIVVFMHWGELYSSEPVTYQRGVAQTLCNLGVNVIVGSHPHVVQPAEIFTSTSNPNQKTVCLYSLGNAVSNQRQSSVARIKTAHTEDGIWFTFTLAKYSDGSVYVDGVDMLPLWVDVRPALHRTYNIIPLDMGRAGEWTSAFGLNETTLELAQKSYERTGKIMNKSVAEAQTVLAEARQQRDAVLQTAYVG